MFWKNAKPKHTWSITLRLSAFYTLSAILMLIFIAFSLHWITSQRLQKKNLQFLNNEILILREILEHHSYLSTALHEEVIVESPLYHYYARVVAANGKILIETPGMTQLLPLTVFNQFRPESNKRVNIYYWHSPIKSQDPKKYYLLASSKLDSVNAKESPLSIQLAMDVTSEHKLMEDYRNNMLLVLLIGIIGSTVLSTLITRNGLKPLHDIIHSAQVTTATQLTQRLNPTDWPKELSALAVAFNHMLARIEEGFNRLSQFSANLAHELRTPITNLRGETEIALARSRSNEDYCKVLESSLEEYERLSRLIDNLLFLARAENPHTVIDYSMIPVGSVLRTVADFYEASAEEKGVKILCQQNPEMVKSNLLLLRQAISNLVSNALRHTPPGGTIVLTAQQIEYKELHIAVIDSGEGIEEKHIQHLFDRFYRVDDARSMNTGGTGLGLAIVKSIMDLHQGKVTVTSQINRGTTITLIFPLHVTLPCA